MKYLKTMLVGMMVLFVGIGYLQAEEEAKEEKRDRSSCGRHERNKPRHFHKKMLEKYDADKDGKLSNEERAKMKENLKARRKEKKQEWIKKYDTDGDGKLSNEERKKAKEAFREKMKQHVGEMFDKADSDGNGQLSREEVHTLLKNMRKMHGRGGKGGCKKSHGAGEEKVATTILR